MDEHNAPNKRVTTNSISHQPNGRQLLVAFTDKSATNVCNILSLGCASPYILIYCVGIKIGLLAMSKIG